MDKLLVNSYIKYIIIFILIFIVVIGCLIYYFGIYQNNNSNQEIVSISNDILNENKPPVEEEKMIIVDVKGAVKNPGVYELTNGSRVHDAIKMSGGLTNKGDTSVINLSKKLEDEMVIIVYTKDEVKALNKNNEIIKYVDKECVCPKITNGACINDNNSNETKKISLNNATLEELQTLPGIGESKALEIINYRKENGGFKTIEELMNISGIGQSTFEKIKDLVTI